MKLPGRFLQRLAKGTVIASVVLSGLGQTIATLMLALAGLGVWLALAPVGGRQRRYAPVCGSLVALGGLLSVGVDLGRLLAGVYPALAGSRWDAVLLRLGASRMAPQIALSLVFLGAALVVIDVRAAQWRRFVELSILTACLIASSALVGALYGVESLYALAGYTPVLLPTAGAVVGLALSALAVHPDQGLMRIITGETDGGILVRRLPFALGLLLLLGWLTLAGTRAGWFGPELGLSLFAIVSTATILLSTLRAAVVLQRADAKRTAAHDVLRLRARTGLAALGQRALAGTAAPGLMDEAVGLVAQALAADCCELVELSTDGKGLFVRAAAGWARDHVGKSFSSAATESVVGWTLACRAPVIIDDVPRNQQFRDDPRFTRHAVASALSVTVPGPGRAVGVLAAYTTRPRIFSKDDIHLLENIAAVVATAMSHDKLTRSVNELECRTREITLLNDMADLLQTCVRAPEAYAVGEQFARQLFPGDAGALCVLSESRQVVEAVAVWGDLPPATLVFEPGECWALRRGRMHPGRDTAGLVCPHLRQPSPSGAHLCVPMMAQGEALGVLHLRETMTGTGPADGVTESKRRLVVAVAEHMALALANLKLRETLHSQSIHDGVTGLYNRQYMEVSLEREVRRANRTHRPLGLILLDLDHFKEFNDGHGHDAGDQLLRAAGRIMTEYTRAEDLACRYGGDELLVVLPESPLAATRDRAETLRKAVSDVRLQYQGGELRSVSASLGVAAFPDHGTSVGALLRAADAALYRAKAEGRNRVVAAGAA